MENFIFKNNPTISINIIKHLKYYLLIYFIIYSIYMNSIVSHYHISSNFINERLNVKLHPTQNKTSIFKGKERVDWVMVEVGHLYIKVMYLPFLMECI